MGKPLVAIDPGHGGTDPGAVSGGVRESAVVLAHALALGAELERRGCAVLYTRREDQALDLAGRCRAANEAGAALFVSVHCNASASPAPNGFQAFHCAGSARGKLLAETIHAAALGVTSKTTWSGVYPDASPQCGNRTLYVLRGTKAPAVLLELGFLTHQGDRTTLTDQARRAELAGAIAGAIAGHLGVPA